MDYLSKESLTEILNEYKRQRAFSQDGVTRADGAIMAIEQLIKVSFPDAPPAPPVNAVGPLTTIETPTA